MAKILEMIPIVNIFSSLWDWADGDKYTVKENNTVLPPELAESEQKIKELADKHYKTQPKGNGGKGKGKAQFKVEKEQLNTKKVESKVQEEKVVEEERGDR